MRNRRVEQATLLAGVLLLGACDDATGPELDSTFDAEAALADYQALEQIFESGAFAGFRSLEGRTPFSGTASVGVVGGLEAEGSRNLATRLVRGARASLETSTDQRAPLISGQTRGATFVYDPLTDDYTLDPDRGGAPETGVRFILYEVDGGGTPILEREIGYTDLIDEGDASAEDIALRLTAVANGRTHLDYRTTLSAMETGGALTVEGFVQGDGEARLDFDIQAVGREANGTEELDVDFDLDVDRRDFHIDGRVRGVSEQSDDGGDVEVTVRHGADSFGLTASVVDGVLDGSIALNGDLFVRASGPSDDPTFTRPDGAPLNGVEVLVLISIVDAVEDVFDLLEDLVDPVDNLVILGLLL